MTWSSDDISPCLSVHPKALESELWLGKRSCENGSHRAACEADLYRMLFWTLILASSALAEPLRPTITSCLNSYPPVAPESARLSVTDVLASIVSNQEAAREGLQGNGVQVLRINLLGQTASELQGYNNDTNKLGE